MPFTQAVLVNPPVPLEKGKVYPFVDMASVNPAGRSVRESEHREFKGGGSRFMPGDTLMARITPCLENGKIARFRPTDGSSAGFGSTEFIVIRGRDGITDNDFAYYLTKWDEFRQFAVSQMAGTSGRQRVPAESLAHFAAQVPPLPVQLRIAAILGALDDKIELNRRMSRTLEAMARALFKSWFVDFDPVRAKAEGRAPGLPAEIADLFPDRLVDSELGEIPEGWEVGTLADFAALNPESWSKDTRPEVIRYVDLSNTKWGRIETVTTHTRHDAPSRAQRVLRPGDTLVGTVRPGNGSYALVAEEGLTGSTGFAVLRPQKAEWAEFVYLAATAASNIDTLAHLADGAAYPAVRPEVVASTPVVRPDDSVLGEFSRYAAPALARMAQGERESRTLAALRDALLPKLLSGEIDVPACAADVAAGRSALEGPADPPAQAGLPAPPPPRQAGEVA
jgi:type I restriction enzyme S subunit